MHCMMSCYGRLASLHTSFSVATAADLLMSRPGMVTSICKIRMEIMKTEEKAYSLFQICRVPVYFTSLLVLKDQSISCHHHVIRGWAIGNHVSIHLVVTYSSHLTLSSASIYVKTNNIWSPNFQLQSQSRASSRCNLRHLIYDSIQSLQDLDRRGLASP